MIDRFVPGAFWSPPGECRFLVWAPRAEQLILHLLGEKPLALPMRRSSDGYHQLVVQGIQPGRRYQFELPNGSRRPDPASRAQPDGVHGPSAVVDPRFDWDEGDWKGIALRDLLFYELHVGTFTPEGTFDGVISQLDRLHDLGITALNIMPVAEFPGPRNWGYDGVQPFCVQSSYGGPAGLKRLINAAHRRGLAVFLDVVYNHLGPEGNYLREFAPYFTDRYHNPWGEAINFDGPDSDHVRHYFLMNALVWQDEFRFDGLRLDAVHAIKDLSAIPFLAELAEQSRREAQRLERPFHLVAESDLNDSRLVRPAAENGIGLHASWSDDFHHSVHALLTGERSGYYVDFGLPRELVWAYRDGVVYTGQFAPHRGRQHGNSPHGLRPEQFVVCIQNHDQVGNRACGDRLSTLVDPPTLRLAAGLLLLSPYTPLLFMGEEYGERRPFLYFTSHGDPGLVEAVRQGRRAEFAAFGWPGEVPDPQDESTFARSCLDPAGGDSSLCDLYRSLIALRRSLPLDGARSVFPDPEGKALHVSYQRGVEAVCIVFRLDPQAGTSDWRWPQGRWHKLFSSTPEIVEHFHSTGQVSLTLPGRAFVVYRREEG